MTSTASQPVQVPAPNNTAPSATSYASAAGAAKKPASGPVIVAGTTTSPAPATTASSQAPVVVSSNVANPPIARTPSGPATNGRPPFAPAVPSVVSSSTAPVVHGSSNVNGGAVAHSRNPSVTISANAAPTNFAQNGGPVGGRGKPDLVFGSVTDSPAAGHSTPQAGGSAPIAIPGSNAQRVPSPAQSPSPIPMPSASGGRPPSGVASSSQMTFGSFQGDGDVSYQGRFPLVKVGELNLLQRPPRQPSIPQNVAQTGAHIRRDSNQSMTGDMGTHGGPNSGRGGYASQAGRGGRQNNFNNAAQYNPNAMAFGVGRGYPAQQGRGGMPAGYGRGMPFSNSPRGSPALQHSMPQIGTPNMAPAVPMQGPGQQFYPQMHQQYVKQTPSFFDSANNSFKKVKARGGRRYEDPTPRNRPRSNSVQRMSNHYDQRFSGRSSKRHGDTGFDSRAGVNRQELPTSPEGFAAVRDYAQRLYPPALPTINKQDLAPGKFEDLLTRHRIQGQYPGFPPNMPPSFDPNMQRPASMQYGYPAMGQMPYSSQSPAPVFASPYGPGPQFQQQVPPPGPQPMSRNSSQISTDRPSSTAAQNSGPIIASGSTQPPPAPPKAPGSSNFVLPKRKNAAIVIKNAAGEAINLNDLKAPASPVPSIQQSKTPPVVASTPTPPPKPATPIHQRTVSAVNANAKSDEEVRREFQEQVRKNAGVPADAKPKEEAPAKEVEAPKDDGEVKAKAPEAVATSDEDQAKPADEPNSVESGKPAAPAAAPAEEVKPDIIPTGAPQQPGETDDEYMDRQIREMEEEDARREKEQEEITQRKKAEAAEAKKRADANRATDSAENDRKLREQEREMERLEEEREKKRAEAEAKEAKPKSVADLLAEEVNDLSLSDSKDSAPSSPGLDADKPEHSGVATPETGSLAPADISAAKAGTGDKAKSKPAALNLAPLNTKPIEPPQPSAALQSLKSARFLTVMNSQVYPEGIRSPNPATNAAVARKGKSFKYDAQFLLQFQKVFTEQPSLEFGQQVKSLIGESDGSRSATSARAPGGGSGRQNSRGGAPAPFAMGSFGAPGAAGKPLPSGTTSEQRFAMSSGQMARPNPMASFGRGVFPGGAPMGRTPSSSNMGNMIPNSPRQGSRSTRGGASKRGGYDAKAEAQAAKTMPLTAGMELKPITTTASGWKPTSVGNRAASNATAPNGMMDPEMVQRKVKSALNKMTPENFDKISDQILAIAGQSVNETDGRTLRQVIQLTFEKATDEAHWASMYAKFCKRMLDTMNPEIKDVTIKDRAGNLVSGGALFRKYLLNRCQEEFERGWKTSAQEQKENEGDVEGAANEAKKAEKPGEVKLMSDEYYKTMKSKRQGLGLVQFIGELYKLGMLTERIMHECVRKLLEFTGIPDEAEIESLTKLLRTIGYNLDQTEKGRPMMDAYFQRIQTIIDIPELPSRLKFMLMDVVDLRKVNWASKEANKGPKTLDEVRADAEAAAAQKAAEAARSSQRGPPGGRPPAGRGDARNFSYNQPAPNQVGMDDLRRLKGSAGRTASSNVTLGPTSMFSSRSNSGRARLGPAGALARAGEDSGTSSRTGTPPTREREQSVAHTNAFG
jgi:translation initiation factor 4G